MLGAQPGPVHRGTSALHPSLHLVPTSRVPQTFHVGLGSGGRFLAPQNKFMYPMQAGARCQGPALYGIFTPSGVQGLTSALGLFQDG